MMQNQLPYVLLKLHFSLTWTTKQDLHDVNIFSNKSFVRPLLQKMLEPMNYYKRITAGLSNDKPDYKNGTERECQQ